MSWGPHDLLRAMIAIDSVNRAISGRPAAEAAMGDWVERTAAGLGLEAHRLSVPGEADDLLVTAPARGDTPWILFESHLDTVGIDGMTVAPFTPTDSPGRIHGRGACDTKGSGAAMLWALAEHARAMAAGEPGANGAILFAVDEEIARAGVDAFVDTHLPALPWRPAAVVVGEPTRLRAVVAHRGVVRATVRTAGVAAHSSDPSRGRSAIRAMLPVLRGFEERYIPGLAASHPLTGPAVCSVNVIRGGTGVNTIPDRCEIGFDRRTVPGERVEDVLAAIEALLDELRAADPDLQVELVDPIVHPTFDPETNRGWAAAVGSTLERLGLPGEGIGVGYGTDASAFARVGLPAVVLGPGDIAQAHAADEWLELAQLEGAVRVYRELLRAGVPGG
jgi:acetylornithine deacetylase